MQQNQGFNEPDRNQIALEDIEGIEEINNQYLQWIQIVKLVWI